MDDFYITMIDLVSRQCLHVPSNDRDCWLLDPRVDIADLVSQSIHAVGGFEMVSRHVRVLGHGLAATFGCSQVFNGLCQLTGTGVECPDTPIPVFSLDGWPSFYYGWISEQLIRQRLKLQEPARTSRIWSVPTVNNSRHV